VAIVDFAFEPATLRVAAGTTVLWTNTGQAPHTVTGQLADSGTLDAGGTFSHTFEQEGAFDYVCSFHPQMTGQIQVGAATSAPADGAARSQVTDADAAGAALPVRADRALVGAWQVGLTPADDADFVPQRALMTFHADGTVDAVYAAAGDADDASAPTLSSGQGAWEVDASGGYALTVVAFLLDESDRFAGTLTVHESGEIDETGDTYRGTFSFETTTPEGDTSSTGSGTTRGTRVTVEDGASAPEPASESDGTGANSATVTIQGFAFDPPTIEVSVGTTVTWVNRDEAPHTATGDDGGFDTGQLDQGQSGSVTFDQAGSFAYRCNFHPDMRGTVVVT